MNFFDQGQRPQPSTQIIQRFFEISPIHGCSFIGFRVSVFEAIFWSLAVTASTCFFIYDLVTLCSKFAAETTAVSATLQRNQTLAFTDAAVCMDVFRLTLADSINAVFNESHFNASIHKVSKSLNASSGLIDLSTLPANDTDVDIVLKTTYLLIAAIVDYDLGTPGGGNPGYNSAISRAVDLVDAFFKEQGYGYDQLSTQAVRYMCKQTYAHNCSVWVEGLDNFCIDLCATANITWVGYTMAFAPFDDICFALNTPAVNVFRSSADIFAFDTIFVQYVSLLIADWPNYGQPGMDLFGYGLPHLSFDMRGWRGFMDPRNLDGVAFIGDGNGYLVGVEIQSQYLLYNHSWGTCGTLQFTDCALFNCLPAARMAADGCWPLAGYSLTSARKPAHVPICGLRYTTAQVNSIPSSYVGTWETCLYQKCSVAPCNSFEYDYAQSYTSYANTGVNATLYQGKLSYAVFDQYLAMDTNAFMAALGGSLGLYLGGSLIAVGHIPLYIIFWSILNWRMRRKSKELKPTIVENPSATRANEPPANKAASAAPEILVVPNSITKTVVKRMRKANASPTSSSRLIQSDSSPRSTQPKARRKRMLLV